MKFHLRLITFTAILSLIVSCNDDPSLTPTPPPDADDKPENFIHSAFQIYEDCLVYEQAAGLGLYGTNLVLQWFSTSEASIHYVLPENLCGKFHLIDSSGTSIHGTLTTYSGCEGYPGYQPGDASLPDGFVREDTLYLQDYLLTSWPSGRPAWDHVIYTRVIAYTDTLRYALPRLCGQYALIDQDGQLVDYFVGVGGCSGYQALKN